MSNEIRAALDSIRRPIAVRPPKVRPTYTVPGVPKTPDGLSGCNEGIDYKGELPRHLGETIRYTVEVNGLSVGLVDFKTEREGLFKGQPVTEYRSHFQIDSLVATLVPVEGRAASIVPEGKNQPIHAMNRYRLKQKNYEEELSWDKDTSRLISKRSREGKPRTVKRLFTSESRDFITAFYLLRAMKPKFSGCTLLFANQRAYTIELKYAGEDKVQTPVGLKEAYRYEVIYAHERSKKPVHATIWMSKSSDRLPYQAEIRGRSHLFARIHLFIPGES
jgi:hypothetical protein